MMSSYYLPAAVSLALLFYCLRAIVRRFRAHSISQLPGPPPGRWLAGNLPDLFRPLNAADAEFAWTEKYGTAIKINGAWGIDVLFISDPKGLQYIFNTAGYHFVKPQQQITTTRLVAGEGLIYASGNQHVRQRKIMNPAFSYTTLRVFLPLFRYTIKKTASKWKDIMAKNGSNSAVLDIPGWMARTTLDALGQAAFDYDFGAIDETENELNSVYSNLFADSFYNRSDFHIAFEALWGYIPKEFARRIENMPVKRMRRLRKYMRVASGVAKTVVDRQTEILADGKAGGKDVMSILIMANLSEDPRTRLSNHEIKSQLTTLMLAGHETTASTVTWALYELAKLPEFQTQVREEIRAIRVQAAQRGDGELSVADLDSMKYLLATMKETLRYHPIATLLHREATRDDVIPLAAPQTTRTGEVINSIPVSKGQRIMVSVAAYNRLRSVWGEDANVWRPQRFLEGVDSIQKTGLGVISNIATFGSGVRNCIGWRFALIEMQAILIELLENFEFSVAPGNPETIRGASHFVTPMLKSNPGQAQLPLTVTQVEN